MSDHDMIRRGDIMPAISAVAVDTFLLEVAIRALPATAFLAQHGPTIAAPYVAAARVVKPLEWRGAGWDQYAQSVAGTYRVFERHGFWRAVVHTVEDAYFIAETETEIAAKAAAQADYESRARSMWTIPPAPAPDVAGLVEAAKAVLDDVDNGRAAVRDDAAQALRAALAQIGGPHD